MKTIDLLKKRGFFGLFISQATGAFNDNALKMVLIGIVLATRPEAEHGGYLSLFNAMLIAPFIIFSPAAGWLSDRFSKRSVLIGFKGTEFLILGLAVLALYIDNIWLLFSLLILMGTQSTFYSPAKYGILKEIASEKRLGQANGIIEMGTILAIIIGTVGGSLLYDTFSSSTGNHTLLIPLLILSVFSFTGLIFTLRIESLPSSSTDSFNIKDFFQNIKELKKSRSLRLTVVGITYFWFSAMLFNLLLILFGTQSMGMKTVTDASLLFFYISLGVAIGAFISARVSRHRVEVGLIPTGSIGMGITSIILPLFSGNYLLVVTDLILLGIFGGMFVVPLNTLLQLESDEDKRGRLIAITNMFTNIGMLLSSAILALFSTLLKIGPDTILIILGIFSFVISVYIFFLLPEAFFNFSLGILTHTIYRIKAVNHDIVPETGSVLLTPNHMTFVDGLILQFSIPHRKIRFVVYKSFFDLPLIGWFLRVAGCIPISEKRAKDAILKIGDALRNGDVVCIFPEGSLTRIGVLLPFKKGVELILKKTPPDTVVIPVYFDKLWGSIFSFKGKRYLWKIPERLPYPVTVCFGRALNKDITAFELRQKVSELGTEAFSMRRKEYKTLPTYFIRAAKRFMFRKEAVDISDKPITYLRLLTASILLSKKIDRLTNGQRMIGIMLPASIGAVISNIAIGLISKVSVNLNFRSGEDSITKSMSKSEIKTIITSKLFARKIGLKRMKEFIYLEDIVKEINPVERIMVYLSIIILPSSILTLLYHKGNPSPDDIATIIFSSGSTGDPKGVMLSHTNIISNGEMVSQVMQFTSYDSMIGSLPFFHSFGYTVTFWLPLLKDVFIAYSPDPLDAKRIGEMAGRYKSTIILGTPTFYSLYTRSCKKEDFQYLRIAIAGAERLRENVAETFRKKFGVSLLEGYGTTEMSPVISCNLPDYSGKDIVQIGTKEKSVGLPLPGVSAKVVDPENYDTELSHGEEGMLLVKGPNMMVGYLKDKERTEEVRHNDWYITGDIARIDEDGFIYIVGRLSRFSKIGGEMVPHVQVEEVIHRVLNLDNFLLAVTSVKDEAKGERLVVLYLQAAADMIDQKSIKERLKGAGLPNLWIPKEYYQIEGFPMLASGKIDLKGLNRMAEEAVIKR